MSTAELLRLPQTRPDLDPTVPRQRQRQLERLESAERIEWQVVISAHTRQVGELAVFWVRNEAGKLYLAAERPDGSYARLSASLHAEPSTAELSAFVDSLAEIR